MLVCMAAAQPHRLAEIMAARGLSDRQLGMVLAALDGKSAETWRIRVLRYRHGTKMTPAVVELFTRALSEATGTPVTPQQLLAHDQPSENPAGAQTPSQELAARVEALEQEIHGLRRDLHDHLRELRRARPGGPEATSRHHQVASECE